MCGVTIKAPVATVAATMADPIAEWIRFMNWFLFSSSIRDVL
jgi:hypothetical protein